MVPWIRQKNSGRKIAKLPVHCWLGRLHLNLTGICLQFLREEDVRFSEVNYTMRGRIEP